MEWKRHRDDREQLARSDHRRERSHALAAPKRQETAEGIERDMAVSYLSRLVILREIAPRLGKNRPAAKMKPRVFIMGFPGAGQAGTLDDLNAEKSYGAMRVHMNTVADNEMPFNLQEKSEARLSSVGTLDVKARHLWLRRRGSSRFGARRCRQRTSPTSDASERSVRTGHGAPLFLAEALSESRRQG
jgi:hypothetical protein